MAEGWLLRVLKEQKEIAKAENCYRLILMTGSKLDSTLNFYRKAGYDDKEKDRVYTIFRLNRMSRLKKKANGSF